jgi:hypothetical protein
MLLGSTIFSSLPIEHACSPGTSSLTVPELFARSHIPHHYLHHYVDSAALFDEDAIKERPVLPFPDDVPIEPPRRSPIDRPRRPPRPPRRPIHEPPEDEPRHPEPPAHPRPRPPVSPIPPGRESGVCYSNGVTESTAVLSWVFFAMTALWFILEMAVTEPRSSAISRAIMGTLTFPLIVALFSIVFNRWNVYHSL